MLDKGRRHVKNWMSFSAFSMKEEQGKFAYINVTTSKASLTISFIILSIARFENQL